MQVSHASHDGRRPAHSPCKNGIVGQVHYTHVAAGAQNDRGRSSALWYVLRWITVQKLAPLISSFYGIWENWQIWLGRSDLTANLFQMLPCLIYAIEACPVNKTQEKSLEFTINRTLMKLFRTVIWCYQRVSLLLWYNRYQVVNCHT